MSEFFLEIITPEKIFFSGNVAQVICQTTEGELGILKGHQTMVAALKVGEIRLNFDNKWKSAFISEGFMEVRPDKSVIFSQSCEWPEDIDEERAEHAKIIALENISHENGIREHRHNEISLARAMTRLKIKKTIK